MSVIQRKYLRLTGVSLAVAMLLAGCGGSNSNHSATRTALNYSAEIQDFAVGIPLTPISPSTAGSGSYTIQPALPAGLTMDVNGVISGTPLAAAPMTTYVITRGSGANASTTEITFDVLLAQVAPAGLHYNSPFVSLPFGRAMQPIFPDSSGGQSTSFSVSPALPTGISLDPTTGVISGTATGAFDLDKYTITATNTAGSSTTRIVLGAQPVPGSFTINYEPRSLRLQPGVTMKPQKILTLSGEIVSCSVVSSVLPEGLSLNPATCEITGTPTEVELQLVKVIATDINGDTATTRFPLEVVNTPAESTSFTYPNENYFVAVNESILINGIRTTGDEIDSFSASGLPAGLSMNASDGTISGTPTVVANAVPVTVTGITRAGNAVTTTLDLTVLSTPSGTISTVNGIDEIQAGNSYYIRINPTKSNYRFVPGNAHDYCEITVKEQLGRRYVLPNQLEMITILYLDIFKNPGNYTGWTLGKTWYESQGDPDKNIGYVDLSYMPTCDAVTGKCDFDTSKMMQSLDINTTEMFYATCRPG